MYICIHVQIYLSIYLYKHNRPETQRGTGLTLGHSQTWHAADEESIITTYRCIYPCIYVYMYISIYLSIYRYKHTQPEIRRGILFPRAWSNLACQGRGVGSTRYIHVYMYTCTYLSFYLSIDINIPARNPPWNLLPSGIVKPSTWRRGVVYISVYTSTHTETHTHTHT